MSALHPAATRAAVDVAVTGSLAEIHPDEWDHAVKGQGLFLSYEWLKAEVERPLDRSHYLLARDREGRAAAAAVCFMVEPGTYSCYDPNRLLLPDGCLAGMHAGEESPGGCAASPLAGFSYPILTCVSPGFLPGIGQRGDSEEVVDGLLDVVDQVAADSGASAKAFLYLRSSGQELVQERLSQRGYRPFVVGAENVLAMRWASFDDYLASQGKHKRWKFEHEIESFARSGLRVRVTGPEGLTADLAPLLANVQRKYGHEASLEKIRADQKRIRAHLGSSVRVFRAERDGRTVGFSLFYEYDDLLWSRSVGFDYDRLGHDFCYFNLLFYEPIRFAIEAGLAGIHYSTGAYQAKVSRGCGLRLLLGYLQAPEEMDVESLIAASDAAQVESLRRWTDERPPGVPPDALAQAAFPGPTNTI